MTMKMIILCRSPYQVTPKIPSDIKAVIGKLETIMNMHKLLKKIDFKWNDI